ncbi:MAG TPA: hypothetical protein VEG38_06910 [Acidimicrobiia bacterium]|nr:hypothetical protein [Acidimicrobiia bacterium]
MTLILMVATLGLLTFLGLSCRRARLDLEEQICECLHNPVAAAVGYGGRGVELLPVAPVLTGIDGGRQGPGATGRARPPHLRVVKAG